MKAKQQGFTLIELMIVPLFLAGAFGWGWNIVKLIDMGFDVINGLMIVRAVGIFIAPLGAVMGYI